MDDISPTTMSAAAEQITTSNRGAPLPEGIAQLARSIAHWLEVTVDELFIADHTHEELSRPDAYSIAFEGDYGWPFRYVKAAFGGDVTDGPAGWWLESGTGWFLAAYPDPHMHKCERCGRMVDEAYLGPVGDVCGDCTDHTNSRITR